MDLLAAVPMPYRWAALAALAAAAWGHGWLTGREQMQEALERAQLKNADVVIKWKERDRQHTDKVVTRYVDRVQTVTETVTRLELIAPELRHDEDLARILLPAAERVLHDLAASGGDPAGAGALAAQAAPVDLLTYTRTVRENYRRCRLNAEQMTGLQDWAAGPVDAPQSLR